jgi:hypothetical protein
MGSAVFRDEEATRFGSDEHDAVIGRVDRNRVGSTTVGDVWLEFLERPID